MLITQSFKNNTYIYLIKLSTAADTNKQLKHYCTLLETLGKQQLKTNKKIPKHTPNPPVYLNQRENYTKTSSQEWLPTLILKALLNPLAKNPPNGPINEANVDSAMLCIWNGYIFTVSYKESS